MPALSFTHPAALWLLLLLPLIVGSWRSSRAGLPPLRRRAVLATRLAMVAALVLALAGARLLTPSRRACVIFLVDASESMSPTAQEWARGYVAQALHEMRPGDDAGLILFGRDAGFERAPGEGLGRSPLARFATRVDGGATHLAGAMLLAEGAFPPGYLPRMVILSDGNENQGDAAAEAQAAASRGISVWTATPPAGAIRDALVERVTLPDVTRRDEPFDLRVQVRSSVAAAGVLAVTRNGHALGRIPVALHPGENVLFVRQRLARAGAYDYRVTVEIPRDAHPQNDTGEAVAFVQGRPRVLYLHATDAAPGMLPQILRRQGVDVDVRSPRRLPNSLGALQRYAAVILADVAATELSDADLQRLASFTRDLGGGLVMLGGPDAFGAGGYQGTVLEPVLPVSLDIRKRKVLPTVALVIAIDKSGSMSEPAGGVEKMAVARESAIATLSLLGPRDRIGVAAFDEAAKWVVTPRPAARRNEIVAGVATLRAGGGTDMYPALVLALHALAPAKAAIKHVIVLSDGVTAPRDFDALVAQLRRARITVSTVGIGADADRPFMAHLARAGGGRSWFAMDGSVVPRIFTRDALLASRSALVEERFVPRVAEAGNAMLRGLPTAFAPLLGYTVTSPRALAATPLLTRQGDPLLAAWRIGLGKAVAFTSDDGARWAQAWAAWPGAARLWTQAVRWSFADSPDAALGIHTALQGTRVEVAVEAGQTAAGLRATVVGPDGSARPVALRPTGPEQSAGSFGLAGYGAYVLAVWDPASGRQSRRTVVVPYPPEMRTIGNDDYRMARIAAQGGGRFGAPAASAFTRPDGVARIPHEGWQWLALAALLLLPLDVALRRVFLPAGWAKGWRKPSARREPPIEGRTLAALKERKAAETQAREGVAVRREPVPPPAAPAARRPAAGPSGNTLERLKEARRKRDR